MEEKFHIEKHGSLRKAKRLVNKRERIQVKKYLKGNSLEDFVDENDDEDAQYNIDDEPNQDWRD